MIIECARCRFSHSVTDALIPREGAEVQCMECGAVFRVDRPKPSRPDDGRLLNYPAPTSQLARTVVECPACLTRFFAELPGGTAVSCSACDKVFKTPARVSGDRVHIGRQAQRVATLTPSADPLRELSGRSETRRWFSSRAVDVIFWLDEQARPQAFRFCYDKTAYERAVTWSEGKLTHTTVDSGEHRSKAFSYKQGTMLRSEVEFDGPRVMAIFETIRAELPAELARFVAGKLSQRFGAPTRAN